MEPNATAFAAAAPTFTLLPKIIALSDATLLLLPTTRTPVKAPVIVLLLPIAPDSLAATVPLLLPIV